MRKPKMNIVILANCERMPDCNGMVICTATTEGNAMQIAQLLNEHCQQNNILNEYAVSTKWIKQS